MLQVVKTYIPDNNSDIPIGVVAVESVDEIFQKCLTTSIKSIMGRIVNIGMSLTR